MPIHIVTIRRQIERTVELWPRPFRRVVHTSRTVIGVWGRSWGGDGKTPFAIALTQTLADQGFATAYVGHGYGDTGPVRLISQGEPCLVYGERDAAAAGAGDEAIIASQTLFLPTQSDVSRIEPVVISGGSRDGRLLALGSRVGILDGSQIVGDRGLSVEVSSDASAVSVRTFGEVFQCPAVLHVKQFTDPRNVGREKHQFTDPPQVGRSLKVLEGGRENSDFARYRLGLITSFAQPKRVLAQLQRHDIAPCLWLERSDHQPFSRRELAQTVELERTYALDGWLLDAKSEVHLAAIERDHDFSDCLSSNRAKMVLEVALPQDLRELFIRWAESAARNQDRVSSRPSP